MAKETKQKQKKCAAGTVERNNELALLLSQAGIFIHADHAADVKGRSVYYVAADLIEPFTLRAEGSAQRIVSTLCRLLNANGLDGIGAGLT